MTQKVNNGVKKIFRNLKAFSLVELIIVIAIVAILSVAGFLTLQKRISQSRDSKRLGDLETIEKSLTVNYADSDTPEVYPKPDENNDGSEVTTGEIDGETVAYKGTFGSGAIENVDNLNEILVDPLDDDRYAYGVTEDQKYFQISAVLENGEKVSYKLMDRAYAADKKSIVRGNYDGLMVYTSGDSNYISNIPSLIFNNTGSLTNTGEVSYVVDGSSNLAYGEDTTQKESFEKTISKTYGLSGDASVSFVNTGVNKVKDAIESGDLDENIENSLGGNEGVIESKLEESGVSVDSSDDNKEWNLSGTRNNKYEYDGYEVLAFTDVGNHKLEVVDCPGECEIDILIVAGGGAGGCGYGDGYWGNGGGGAGGLLQNSVVLSEKVYRIVVGSGAKINDCSTTHSAGENGKNSFFDDIGTVIGGGGGGGHGEGPHYGLDGGSGGGATGRGGYSGGSPELGQGHKGGDDVGGSGGGAGGGGAGEAGKDTDDNPVGKAGGKGVCFVDIFGKLYGEDGCFAGGGGGGVGGNRTDYGGSGGIGGGGRGGGSYNSVAGEKGIANSGGGGGGGYNTESSSADGGGGGSGIVLVRYPKN